MHLLRNLLFPLWSATTIGRLSLSFGTRSTFWGAEEAGHAANTLAVVGGCSIGSQFYLQGLVWVKIFDRYRASTRYGVLSNKDKGLVLVREVVDDLAIKGKALLGEVLE